MAGELQLDTTDFAKAMKGYMQFTRKTVVEALNSKAGDVAYRAEKLTKRADKHKMDKLLKEGGGNIGKLLKSGKRSKGKSARYQTFNPSGYVYAVLAYYKAHGSMPPWALGVMPKRLLNQTFNSGTRKAMAMQYVNAKKSSIAYIAVGWLMVARFFGKQVSIAKLSAKGWAFDSDGIKATERNPTATLRNFARGADKAPGINKAVQQALDSVVDDMNGYITKKMQARAAQVGLAKV
jgi:uncharacterized protein YejL (UPF0352 family)